MVLFSLRWWPREKFHFYVNATHNPSPPSAHGQSSSIMLLNSCHVVNLVFTRIIHIRLTTVFFCTLARWHFYRFSTGVAFAVMNVNRNSLETAHYSSTRPSSSPRPFSTPAGRGKSADVTGNFYRRPQVWSAAVSYPQFTLRL